MGEPITSAGIIDVIKNILKSFSKDLLSSIDELKDLGIDIKDPKPVKREDETIGALFTAITGDNDKINIKIVQSSGMKNTYDLYLLGDNGAKGSYPHIRADQIDDKITDFIDKEYEGVLEKYSTKDSEDIDLQKEFDNPEVESEDSEVEESTAIVTKENESKVVTNTDVNSSTIIGNSLKKVQACLSKDKDGQVELHKIFCNYDSLEAYEDLQDVIYDDQFNEALTEEPQSFEIVPDEESFEVTHIDGVDDMFKESVHQIFIRQVSTLLLIQKSLIKPSAIRYPDGLIDNVDGLVESIFIKDLENLSYLLNEEMLFTSKHLLRGSMYPEEFDQLIHEAIKLIEDTDDFNKGRGIDTSCGYRLIADYVLILEMYYPNFDHELKHLLDEWILTLRSYMKY